MQSTHLTVATSTTSSAPAVSATSAMETFVQNLLLQEIASTQQIEQLSHRFLPQPQFPTGVWLLIEDYFNETNLQWTILCKAILHDADFQHCLWAIIQASKSSRQHATMAAKAISLLNAAGVN